jgi:hypothetical protein
MFRSRLSFTVKMVLVSGLGVGCVAETSTAEAFTLSSS